MLGYAATLRRRSWLRRCFALRGQVVSAFPWAGRARGSSTYLVGARLALNSQWKIKIVLPSGPGISLVLGSGGFGPFKRRPSMSASSDRLIAPWI